jgi:hypothetical protein
MIVPDYLLPFLMNTITKRNIERDPSWVPRPRNAFIIFRCEYSREHSGVAAGATATTPQSDKTLSKRAAEAWKQLPPSERERYKDLANKEKEEHARLNPNYRFRPVKRQPPIRRNSRTTSASSMQQVPPWNPGRRFSAPDISPRLPRPSEPRRSRSVVESYNNIHPPSVHSNFYSFPLPLSIPPDQNLYQNQNQNQHVISTTDTQSGFYTEIGGGQGFFTYPQHADSGRLALGLQFDPAPSIGVGMGMGEGFYYGCSGGYDGNIALGDAVQLGEMMGDYEFGHGHDQGASGSGSDGFFSDTIYSGGGV